jgi:hypothetical protein
MLLALYVRAHAGRHIHVGTSVETGVSHLLGTCSTDTKPIASHAHPCTWRTSATPAHVLLHSISHPHCLLLHAARHQSKEVAGYALSLLRPGVDAAVLPADSATRDFAEFCREVLGLREAQVRSACSSCCWVTTTV